MLKFNFEMAAFFWNQLQSFRERYGGTRKAGLFALLVVLIGLGLLLIISLYYLGFQSAENYRHRNTAINDVVQRNVHEHALDKIQACIDSSRDSPQLKDRYCLSAVDFYQEIFRVSSSHESAIQAHIKEVIALSAYAEMRNDIRRELRRPEFLMAINSSVPLAQTLLTWLLKAWVGILVLVIILLLALAAGLFFSRRSSVLAKKVSARRTIVRRASRPSAVLMQRRGHSVKTIG